MLITRSKWSKVPKLSSVFDMRSLTPSRRESESVTLGSFKSRSQSCKHRSALVFSRLKNIEKSSAHLTTSVKSLLIFRKVPFWLTFYQQFLHIILQGSHCLSCRIFFLNSMIKVRFICFFSSVTEIDVLGSLF